MGEYQTDQYDMCGGVEEERHLTATLNTLVKSITEIMGVKGCSIRLLDERNGSLQVAAAYGLSKSYLDKGPLLLSQNPVEREILAGKIVSTLDVTKEPGLSTGKKRNAKGSSR